MSEILLLSTEDVPSPLSQMLSQLSTSLNSFAECDMDGIVTLSVINADGMRATNNLAQGKDKATDILSWSYLTDMEEHGNENHVPVHINDNVDGVQDEEERLLGELLICDEICRVQSMENDWSYEVEFIRLVVHGLAHVFGYDHDTTETEAKMLVFEKKLLGKIGLHDIYL